MKPDTFSQARSAHLDKLDTCYALLRKIASDPEWYDPEYTEFLGALEAIQSRLRAIRDLNNAEEMASK